MTQNQAKNPTDIVCEECETNLKFVGISRGKQVFRCECGETEVEQERRKVSTRPMPLPPNSAA